MITLTPEAQAKVSSMLNDAGEGNSLRIFIEPGGCSGFEYGMSIDSPKDKDHFDTISDLTVAVCPDSYDYIRGS